MKHLPFVQRSRAPSPAPVEAAESRRPFRLWMSGSLAVVMAAMVPTRDVSQTDRDTEQRVSRHSRFGVAETVQRIGAAARDQGLSVLALMPGVRPVLVLGSSVGGTPVVMDQADSRPAAPLSVMVCEAPAGGADVLFAAASVFAAQHGWAGLPAAVVDDLEGLSGLVDRALL